jgi:uncharacterized paraquat-inducible protein A
MIFSLLMVYPFEMIPMLEKELQTVLQVSQAHIAFELPKVEGWHFEEQLELCGTKCQVMITEAKRNKCPRCWTYAAEIEGELCGRCDEVLLARESK